MRKFQMQENSRKNKDIGDEGEELAAEHLIGRGFSIVARNVRYKTGEIDIIARRGRELHFIEVKTRRDPSFMPPLEAVTEAKRMRMRRTAEWYLQDPRNGFNKRPLPSCFYGVIGVDLCGNNPGIECILDAFI